MKNQPNIIYSLIAVMAFVLIACDTVEQQEEDRNTEDVPAVFEQYSDNIEVYVDGDVVVITSDGVPDHDSPYFTTSDSRYAAYNGTNTSFQLNPNRIQVQALTIRIPINPQEATVHEATPLGPIGMAVNGVALFNQYAAPGDDLAQEINTFDQYNGHPQQQGMYHYHIEPIYLSAVNGKEALVGFLLDGFPVYGPEENGQAITNADLDAYHGHFAATPEYPDGIYHYHITAEDPYINGSGFFGTAGTVTQ